MSQEHESDIEKLYADLDASRAENMNLRVELNVAKEDAARVNQDLDGTKAALQLQLQLATSSKSKTRQDLGLTQKQEDAICQAWEDIIEEIKVTHREHTERVTDDLRLARAVASDLSEQLAAQHAVFNGRAQAPNTWQQETQPTPTLNHEPTSPIARSNNRFTKLAATRAGARTHNEFILPPPRSLKQLP